MTRDKSLSSNAKFLRMDIFTVATSAVQGIQVNVCSWLCNDTTSGLLVRFHQDYVNLCTRTFKGLVKKMPSPNSSYHSAICLDGLREPRRTSQTVASALNEVRTAMVTRSRELLQ